MSITRSALDFLTSADGAQLLNDVRQRELAPSHLLQIVDQLRKNYSAEQVHAVVSMAQLQQRACHKFGADAERLFFTEAALQQASDPHIRQYRAQTFAGQHVLDLCCGIGTDSIALARAGAHVHAVDYDPLRIAIAQHNADQLGLSITFDCADARTVDGSAFDAIFFDPARRTADGKRIYHVEQYQPPLSTIQRFIPQRVMVKLSPGVQLTQLADYQAKIEFISVDGNLKEAILHTSAAEMLMATKIQAGMRYHWYHEHSVNDVPIAAPHGYLCEPDPAILRANLVQHLAQSFGGTMLHPEIAYFCVDPVSLSPWFRAWKIREWLPFQLKKLRARLREMRVGTVTVKKRGSPMTPEELIRKLKLKGTQSATVVLTKYRDQPIAIICDEMPIS